MKTEIHTNPTTGRFIYGIATLGDVEVHVTDETDSSITCVFYAPCFGRPITMNYRDMHMAFILYSVNEIIDVMNERMKFET